MNIRVGGVVVPVFGLLLNVAIVGWKRENVSHRYCQLICAWKFMKVNIGIFLSTWRSSVNINYEKERVVCIEGIFYVKNWNVKNLNRKDHKFSLVEIVPLIWVWGSKGLSNNFLNYWKLSPKMVVECVEGRWNWQETSVQRLCYWRTATGVRG